MKILIISLLRLGDILLHRELARSLKAQNPDCQIHFLIYSQFQSVGPLVPESEKWHVLDRKSLQRILVERQQSPLTAYTHLESVISEINGEKYDLILNATHNRLSVRMMDLLQAQEKRGVALESGRKVPDVNSWQTYLNENFSSHQGSRFHYLEVLHRSLGISMQLPEAAQCRKPGVILLQLLTSDVKKNWGLEKFRELKDRLQKRFPDHQVLGLCSPQEKEQVSQHFQWHEFLTPNLEDARDLLKEVRLLITGDTSIQHLAAQQGCPVVSLFMGSADPVKTAPWQMGAWVIQAQSDCSPCVHSQPCHQSKHLCAQSIEVTTVFELVESLIEKQPVRLARKEISRTGKVAGGFFLQSMNSSLEKQIEQIVWNAYLNGTAPLMEIEGDCSAEEIQALQSRHAMFRQAIALLQENKINFETVEKQFPAWKDSVLRWKLHPSSIRETQVLMQIREDVFNHFSNQKEVSHVGNSELNASERFAQA